MGILRRSRQVLCMLLVTLVTAVSVCPAEADEIKLGEFWFNFAVDRIEGGRIYFIGATGEEQNRPLSDVGALRIADVPQLAQAEALMEEGKWREAAAALAPVRARIRKPWLRSWVTYRLVHAADRAGDATLAVTAYVELTRGPQEARWLAQVPTASLGAASDTVKGQLARRLEGLSGLEGGAAEGVKQLLAVAKGEATVTPTNGADMGDAPAGGAVVMPRGMRPDAVSQLIQAGRFQEAIERSTEELERARGGDLAMRLFQRGIAQLHQGLTANDDGLIRGAGVSFMRVVVYYPTSIYAGASWMEAGLVHHRIGRHDLARMCYENAGNYFSSPEDDPPSFRRLEKLKAELFAATETRP